MQDSRSSHISVITMIHFPARKQVFGIGLVLLFVGLIAGGCSKEYRKYNTYSRKGSLSERDSAAFFFYREGNYEKASLLFEELQNDYRGSDRAKEMLYYYAYSKYQFGLYIVGAYYFEQFHTLYPNDERAPECLYMVAYCYFLESAPHYLDQEFTNKAIGQFQLFINSYPFHERVEEANETITKLRERLANKSFETARLYYDLERYRAAVTSFEVMMQEYPDSRYREEAQFLIFKSALLLAEVSTNRRKRNRYLDAIEYYERFIDKFPRSPFRKEAEVLYQRSRKGLEKLDKV